jgi:GWxTD domain-containing protein
MVSSTSPLALLLALIALGSQVPDGPRPTVPQDPGQGRSLWGPVATYGHMGLIVAGEPLPFVASLSYLSGPNADSTLVVFGLSLTNQALSFRKTDSNFEARYSVILTFKDGEVIRAKLPASEVVKVASYRETVRRDESVVFQKFLFLAPGRLIAEVVVIDGYGSDTTRADFEIDVPRFDSDPMLSSIISIYQGEGRSSRDAMPGVVVNARASTPYGGDSLRLYMEGYGIQPGRFAAVRVAGSGGISIWSDSVRFDPRDGTLSVAFVTLPSDLLAVGTRKVEVAVGDLLSASTPALIALSDERPIASFEDVVSLLRYFDDTAWVAVLRDAAVEDRPARWRQFWTQTDTDPDTALNEALDRYFMRVEEANVRFKEPGTAGWLTDRGEVFVTLGVPDDVRNLEPDRSSGGQGLVRWRYFEEELTLYFIDEANLGRFRLTPASRADFAAAAGRRRNDRDG